MTTKTGKHSEGSRRLDALCHLQPDVAARLTVGRHTSTLFRWRHGETKPDARARADIEAEGIPADLWDVPPIADRCAFCGQTFTTTEGKETHGA
jgi:hypothetical protein